MRAKTVLVVDDEPVNLELVRAVVEHSGLPIRLVAAANGLEGVRRARECCPDLVLMDLKMPVLDGCEATRRLKADPATAAIPVIVVSGETTAEWRARARAAGCDAFMEKPIDVGALVTAIRERVTEPSPRARSASPGPRHVA